MVSIEYLSLVNLNHTYFSALHCFALQILVVHCGINDIPRKPSDDEAEILMNKFDDLYTDIRNLNRR